MAGQGLGPGGWEQHTGREVAKHLLVFYDTSHGSFECSMIKQTAWGDLSPRQTYAVVLQWASGMLS